MKKVLGACALVFIISNSLAACSFLPTSSEPELGAALGSASGAHLDADSGKIFDSIQFRSDAAALPPEADEIVSRAALYLHDNSARQVIVEGHTDHLGEEEHNQMLSEMRAGTIVRALKSRGISDDRITSIGFGESVPVADNSTADGRRQNRRVELVFQ